MAFGSLSVPNGRLFFVADTYDGSRPPWTSRVVKYASGVLALVCTAFQVAGASSLPLAKLLLLLAWISLLVHFWTLDWPKKACRYRNSILLLVAGTAGFCTVKLGLMIAEIKIGEATSLSTIRREVVHQTANETAREVSKLVANPSLTFEGRKRIVFRHGLNT